MTGAEDGHKKQALFNRTCSHLNISYIGWVRTDSLLAGHPVRRYTFSRLLGIFESLQHPYMLRQISADIPRISKLCPDNAPWINENRCPEAGSRCFIQDPVSTADDLCPVAYHWIRYILQRWRGFLKNLVRVNTICADGQQFSPQRLDIRVNSGDRRQFCRSDEGEIAWIEK
jgi:hypothetical protein